MVRTERLLMGMMQVSVTMGEAGYITQTPLPVQHPHLSAYLQQPAHAAPGSTCGALQTPALIVYHGVAR